jgi:4-amino-4-deoxy-L-arabinose transferase-like glycosyltransferase
VSPRALTVATVGGVILGVAYTLSPLTAMFAFAFALLCRAASSGLTAEERRVVLTLLIVAAALRLAVVAGLFLTTDHASVPFGSLFGDEEYFKRRSLWLRSMAMGVDISEADRIYALSEYSDTSYLYWLAVLQILVGSAPYGVHVFSIFLYLGGAVLLYRFMRRTFGSAPAVLSFALVLFIPSLFLWSVSALRESVHFLCMTVGLVGGIEAAREQPWRRRIVWAVAALLALVALRDLRAGSMLLVAASVVAGLVGVRLVHRPRRWAVAILLAVIIVPLAMSRPAIRERMMTTVKEAAMNHQGHVFTSGLHYKLLEPQFYFERRAGVMEGMTAAQATRFVGRALVEAVFVPLPWQPQTVLTRAYLPEHVLWLTLAALVPIGVWIGWRQHPTATIVLTSIVGLMWAAIAVRSGNVGTLVRHRGLVMPFVVCLSSVAICYLLARVSARVAQTEGSPMDEKSLIRSSRWL